MRSISSDNASSEISFRAYQDNDYNSLKALLKEAGLFYPYWDGRSSLRKKLLRSPGSIIVAVNEKKVVGCQYAISEIGGFLVQLAVKKEFRGQGIGGKLLKRGEDFLRNKGAGEVIIWADSGNESLLNYYKKRGYKQGRNYTFFTKKLA